MAKITVSKVPPPAVCLVTSSPRYGLTTELKLQFTGCLPKGLCPDAEYIEQWPVIDKFTKPGVARIKQGLSTHSNRIESVVWIVEPLWSTGSVPPLRQIEKEAQACGSVLQEIGKGPWAHKAHLIVIVHGKAKRNLDKFKPMRDLQTQVALNCARYFADELNGANLVRPKVTALVFGQDDYTPFCADMGANYWGNTAEVIVAHLQGDIHTPPARYQLFELDYR